MTSASPAFWVGRPSERLHFIWICFWWLIQHGRWMASSLSMSQWLHCIGGPCLCFPSCLGFLVLCSHTSACSMPCNPFLYKLRVPWCFIRQRLSARVSLHVFSICILSRTRRWLHRLRGDPLVPGPRVAGGRYSVRAPRGRVGPGLCVCRAAPREPAVAREVGRWPALPHPKNSRYTEGPHYTTLLVCFHTF